MDNFAYKDPTITTKPSRRVRIKRTVSAFSGSETNGTEEHLLDASTYKRFSTASVRWRRRDLKIALDEELPTDSFEYMFVGPSPPAESAPNMHYSYEESSTEVNVQICPDTIRQTLVELADEASIRKSLIEDIKCPKFTTAIATSIFKNSSKLERDICLLWASFNKRFDLLEPLLKAGADLNFHDSGGMTALHLSSFVGCIKSTEFLMMKGADVNSIHKYFSPLHCAAFGNNPDIIDMLIENDGIITMTTKKTNCEETILHCAVRANAIECLKMLITLEEVDVNSIEPSGANPIHLAANLGMTRCLELLLDVDESNANTRTRIRGKESTALHLAADQGNVDCVNLLLKKGADTTLKNHREFTALHLAARSSSIDCVESLLKNGKSDPNAEDYDKRTPLHVAVRKCEKATKIIEILIDWGAKVNQTDEYGYTPLHLASLDGLLHCVEALIYHGADVTTKSKKGSSALNVIKRKTPTSLTIITQKLDDAINIINSDDSNDREVELQFDFHYILQNRHPREINYLNTFVDEGQKDILLHPLCSAFLHIKWERIRKYYFARLLFCFMFVLFVSLYILTALAHNCYNSSKETETVTDQELCQTQSILGNLLRKNPFVIEMQWWVLAGITIFEIIRKVFGIAGYSTARQYLTQPENLMDWFVIVSVFLISCIYTNSTHPWQNHVGAFAVLAGWTNLMLMVGQFPVFGSYVAMYQKVQKEFAKLFMAYSCILIGFTFSFCVIFPDSSSFANPFMAFIKVITMMIGELDLSLLINEPDGVDPPVLLEISAQITFVLFQLFVTVVLMNLLVGIAVPDIQKLRKTAGLSKLVRQTKLISYMELALFNIFLPQFLSNWVQQSALVSPHPHRVVLSVKPLNPEETRLPKDIMMAAYQIAAKKKSGNQNTTSKTPLAWSFNKSDNCNNFKYTDSHETSFHMLQMKIDERSNEIDCLTNEVNELKDIIKMQRVILQRVIVSLPSHEN